MVSIDTAFNTVSGMAAAGFLYNWVVGTASRLRMVDHLKEFRAFRDSQPRRWPEIYYGLGRAPYGANWPGRPQISAVRSRYSSAFTRAIMFWILAVVFLWLGQHK